MSDNNIIKIEGEFDLEALKGLLDKAADLNDNEHIFQTLAEVQAFKNQLGDIADRVTSVEAEAKRIINSRAKELYGDDWQVISGKHFKISRSFTGAVYNHIGEASDEFIDVKTSVNTKAVEKHVKETNELPTGIEYNGNRGESLRITLK